MQDVGQPAENDVDEAVNSFEECAAFLHAEGYEFDADYLRQLYRAAATKARERYLRE